MVNELLDGEPFSARAWVTVFSSRVYHVSTETVGRRERRRLAWAACRSGLSLRAKPLYQNYQVLESGPCRTRSIAVGGGRRKARHSPKNKVAMLQAGAPREGRRD